MCLAKVTKLGRTPTEGVGYKVFTKRGDNIRPVFFERNNPSSVFIQENTWVNSDAYNDAFDTDLGYEVGWHFFVKEKDAQYYAKKLWIPSTTPAVVKKVKYRKLCAVGKTDLVRTSIVRRRYAKTLVAKEIYVM